MKRIMRYDRIAVCGTHGVGKTGLVGLLAAESGHPIVPDGAREIRKLARMDWWTINASHLARFQAEVFIRHMTAISGRTRFIADRSILDIMACTTYQSQRSLENSSFLQLLRLQLELSARRLSRMHDRLVFYSPAGTELTEEKSGVNSLILDFLAKYAGEWDTVTRLQVYDHFGDRVLGAE